MTARYAVNFSIHLSGNSLRTKEALTPFINLAPPLSRPATNMAFDHSAKYARGLRGKALAPIECDIHCVDPLHLLWALHTYHAALNAADELRFQDSEYIDRFRKPCVFVET